jgi:hypothetical protein
MAAAGVELLGAGEGEAATGGGAVDVVAGDGVGVDVGAVVVVVATTGALPGSSPPPPPQAARLTPTTNGASTRASAFKEPV